MVRLFWHALFSHDADALALRQAERSQMYERCRAIEERLRQVDLALLDEQARIESRAQ